jgi:fatty-acyl-CoA synthase
MDLVARYAAAHPDRLALVEGERTLNWREFFHTRNRLAHALTALGIGAGQHAVIYAHNSADSVVVSAALRAVGAIAVPMNHRLTADEVAYILDNSDATAAFIGDAFLPMAERVRAAAPGVKRWITLGAERRPWAEALDDLLRGGRSEPPPAPAATGG